METKYSCRFFNATSRRRRHFNHAAVNQEKYRNNCFTSKIDVLVARKSMEGLRTYFLKEIPEMFDTELRVLQAEGNSPGIY